MHQPKGAGGGATCLHNTRRSFRAAPCTRNASRFSQRNDAATDRTLQTWEHRSSPHGPHAPQTARIYTAWPPATLLTATRCTCVAAWHVSWHVFCTARSAANHKGLPWSAGPSFQGCKIGFIGRPPRLQVWTSPWMHTDGLVTTVAAVGRGRGGVVRGWADVVGGRGGVVGRGRRRLHGGVGRLHGGGRRLHGGVRRLHGGGRRAHVPLVHARGRRGVVQPPLAVAVEVTITVSWPGGTGKGREGRKVKSWRTRGVSLHQKPTAVAVYAALRGLCVPPWGPLTKVVLTWVAVAGASGDISCAWPRVRANRSALGAGGQQATVPLVCTVAQYYAKVVDACNKRSDRLPTSLRRLLEHGPRRPDGSRPRSRTCAEATKQRLITRHIYTGFRVGCRLSWGVSLLFRRHSSAGWSVEVRSCAAMTSRLCA